MKIIVERLFEHCGYPVPEFQSNEDAVNRFGLFRKKIEGSPILLVRIYMACNCIYRPLRNSGYYSNLDVLLYI